MSKEEFEKINAMLEEVQQEIAALPNSSGSGLLIDARSCVRSSSEKIRRYFMLNQKGN